MVVLFKGEASRKARCKGSRKRRLLGMEGQGGGVPPRLLIYERCARSVECLPMLPHDPNRPEDVLKVDADEEGIGGDDTADALRYLVATRERRILQRKPRGL